MFEEQVNIFHNICEKLYEMWRKEPENNKVPQTLNTLLLKNALI